LSTIALDETITDDDDEGVLLIRGVVGVVGVVGDFFVAASATVLDNFRLLISSTTFAIAGAGDVAAVEDFFIGFKLVIAFLSNCLY
jgi:hypothetical protein